MARFRHRLALWTCALLGLAMLSTELVLTRQLRALRVAELTEDLTAHARLLAEELSSMDSSKPDARLQRLVADRARVLAARVTVIASDGTVVADSGVDFDKLGGVENHRSRPEVHAALASGTGSAVRRSDTVHADFLYAAARRAGDGAVRAAMPLTAVESQVARLRKLVLWVFLAFMVLGAGASAFMARSLTRPLDEMTAVAARLSAGDYRARVRELAADEHGRLGEALNLLASRVSTAVDELSRDKAQLEAILESVVEAIAAVGLDGRLTAVNAAFTKLFSAGPGAVGQPLIEVGRQARLSELVAGVLADGKPRVDETAVFAGEERLFEVHAVPLFEEGRRAGALLVLHDITRLRRLEQVRREFVANVSHELRTPLTSIRGFAETLREGGLDDAAHRLEFVEAIEKDAVRLALLVDDLLDLSAIESGKDRLVREPVDVLALARETAAALRPLAEKGRVRLEVAEAPGLPAAPADRRRLSQVLRNLLDNAVKFNHDGGSVSVSARVDGEALEVTVEDTGSGIPAEDLPRLFERFYRVDKARGREIGGTGLGLSIVKHIVEAHGGRVWAESRHGRGSSFRFTLPLRPS